MNNDFRVTCDSFDHPKLVKLQRICGEGGVLCLFRLWAFTAKYHPRGDFGTMTDEDIEIAAKWNGDPGVFFSALIKFRLLDETLGSYSIHDWEEHNAFAFHAPERSEKAKNAARARWQSDEDATSNATSNAQGNARSNAPSPNPYPKPNPNPKPNPGTNASDNPGKDNGKAYNPEIVEFVTGWFDGSLKASELTAQCDAIDKLTRIDGFPFDEISGILDWVKAGADDNAVFWQGVIHSFVSLRKAKDGRKCNKYLNLKSGYEKSTGRKPRPADSDDSKFKEQGVVKL